MNRVPGGRQPDMMSDSPDWSCSGAMSLALAIEEAQREQRKERSAPTEVLTVLPVEGASVETGVGRSVVALGAAGAAAALTAPVHRVAVARKAEAMAEQTT